MADHGYELLCEEKNFNRTHKIVHDIVQDVMTEKGIVCSINKTILDECLLQSRQSLGFYGKLKDKDVSHYKEVGHIAFWINKLKPVRIVSIPSEIGILEKIANIATEPIMGELVKQEETNPDNDYQINEHVALIFGLTVIHRIQRHEAKDKKLKKKQQESYRESIADAVQIAEDMQSDIINSLRYFTFSARGLALMFETLTRTRNG